MQLDQDVWGQWCKTMGIRCSLNNATLLTRCCGVKVEELLHMESVWMLRELEKQDFMAPEEEKRCV